MEQAELSDKIKEIRLNEMKEEHSEESITQSKKAQKKLQAKEEKERRKQEIQSRLEKEQHEREMEVSTLNFRKREQDIQAIIIEISQLWIVFPYRTIHKISMVYYR